MSVLTSSRSRFALWCGLAMLILLVMGFGPSFFFRAGGSRPPLPSYLVLHGMAGTAWFLLFLVQVSFAARRDATWHRRMGMAGIAVAVAFIVTGVLATLAFTQKMVEQGDFVAANGSGSTFVHWAIAASYGGLVMFAGTLGAALYWRRRPDIHGRLMLVATAGLLGPAFSRIVGWFVALPHPLMIVTLAFMVAMVVHDIRTRGRPHVATVVGNLYANGIIGAFMVLDVGRWAMERAS